MYSLNNILWETPAIKELIGLMRIHVLSYCVYFSSKKDNTTKIDLSQYTV